MLFALSSKEKITKQIIYCECINSIIDNLLKIKYR